MGRGLLEHLLTYFRLQHPFSSLSYTTSCDLEIHQLDTVSAYLNSDLQEEIYLWPPDGVPVKLSGEGPIPVRPGSVSTGIDPMRRGLASLKGSPSLLSQQPNRSVQGLYRD